MVLFLYDNFDDYKINSLFSHPRTSPVWIYVLLDLLADLKLETLFVSENSGWEK